MKRGLKYEFNSIVALLIIIMSLVMIMLIVRNHPQKWDLTKSKLNTLSGQSVNVLKELKNPVKAVAFVSGGRDKQIQALLQLYRAKSPRFSYEFIDPNKNPKKAADYEVTSDRVIFIEYAAKRERVTVFNEENITNAIVRVATVDRKTVYVLSGHGEMALEQLQKGEAKNSLSVLASALEKEIYSLKYLNLSQQTDVPGDAALVVIAAPVSAFFKNETDSLCRYIDRGGKVLWFLGSKSIKENAGLLDYLGVSYSDGFVEDDMSKMLGADRFMTVVAINSNSDITAGFRNSVCLFPLCRAVFYPKTPPKDTLFTPFASTSSQSRIIKAEDSHKISSTESGTEKVIDNTGSYCVALAVERKNGELISRSIVFGSSLLASDAVISQGENKNLLLNSVAWLTEEKNLISIRPKDEQIVMLSLTDESTLQIFFYSVVFLPSIFAFLWLSMRIARRIGGKKQ